MHPALSHRAVTHLPYHMRRSPPAPHRPPDRLTALYLYPCPLPNLRSCPLTDLRSCPLPDMRSCPLPDLHSCPLPDMRWCPRVLAVPTAQLNARRIAKLLQNPVVSTISQQIMSFETPASCLYVQVRPAAPTCTGHPLRKRVHCSAEGGARVPGLLAFSFFGGVDSVLSILALAPSCGPSLGSSHPRELDRRYGKPACLRPAPAAQLSPPPCAEFPRADWTGVQ